MRHALVSLSQTPTNHRVGSDISWISVFVGVDMLKHENAASRLLFLLVAPCCNCQSRSLSEVQRSQPRFATLPVYGATLPLLLRCSPCFLWTAQTAAQQRHAEAWPEMQQLRQLGHVVAAGEATLEEVAPTRYNLVRLVLVRSMRAFQTLP